MAKVIFKPYEQNQMYLLPPSLDEMIPPNHPVRIVNQIIDKINIKPLLKLYKGGGSSSYNAKMMLKILIYSYQKNIYSSRKIEEMTKENLLTCPGKIFPKLSYYFSISYEGKIGNLSH